MWTRDLLAKTIDHAALDPCFNDNDIIRACETGKKFGVATVCLRPTDAPLGGRLLSGSGVGLSIVVGFPHGSNRTECKALEARLAIEDTAVELDMVINSGKLLTGDYLYVKNDIKAVVKEAQKQGVLVKVILETCRLTLDQIAKACEISRDAGADYVKTSTGFDKGGATFEAVEVMIRTVGDVMKVKASGGIKNLKTAAAFLDMGCERLGLSSTEEILNELPE